MTPTNWLKQTDSPLFENLQWNKPERRDQAGRLLIIGGYLHNLEAPAKAYEFATKQGIGEITLALPSKTKLLLGNTLPGALFLPSTNSGELAREGLTELIEYTSLSDTLLLPGDIGRNSQTTLLLADLLTHTETPAIITRDAFDCLKNTPEILAERTRTILVLSFAQFQKFAQELNEPMAVSSTMDLLKLIEYIRDFTANNPCSIATVHQNKLIVSVNGKISTTPIDESAQKSWRTKYATIAACYQTWNPTKPFEALTHAGYVLTYGEKS